MPGNWHIDPADRRGRITRRTVLTLAGAGIVAAGVGPSTIVADANGTTVYVAGGRFSRDEGALYAVNSDGDIEWEWIPPGDEGHGGPDKYIRTPPTVVDGTVYLCTGEGIFYGVDAASGDTSLELDLGVEGPPTIVDGTAYVADPVAYAIDLATGSIRWENDDREWTDDVTVHNGSVYLVPDEGGVISVLDTNTGDVEREFEAEDDAIEEYTPLVIYEGVIYVGGLKGSFDPSVLQAIDAESGTLLWAEELDERTGSGSWPVAADGAVYCGTSFGWMLSFDAETGEENWSHQFDDPVSEQDVAASTAPVAVVDGFVYGTTDEELYCLDAATGDVEWTFADDFSEPISGTPTVYDGVVYVSSSGNTSHYETDELRLFAVEAATGEKRWAVVPDDNAAALAARPTVVADPATGSSVGTRVIQGVYGHTEASADDVMNDDDGTGDEASLGDDDDGIAGTSPGDGEGDDVSGDDTDDADDGLPWPGVLGTVSAIGGATYLWRARQQNDD